MSEAAGVVLFVLFLMWLTGAIEVRVSHEPVECVATIEKVAE